MSVQDIIRSSIRLKPSSLLTRVKCLSNFRELIGQSSIGWLQLLGRAHRSLLLLQSFFPVVLSLLRRLNFLFERVHIFSEDVDDLWILSNINWRLPLSVLDIELGVISQEISEGLTIAILRCIVSWRVSVRVSGINISFVLHQDLSCVEISSEGGNMKRSSSVDGPGLHVSSIA